MVKKPLSLYFHIPFCTKKCPYCHFYVIPNKEEYRKILLDGFSLEYKRLASIIAEHKIVSIYFGGGTPTLFGIKAIQIILEKIPFSSDCEVTIEANPEDVTKELLLGLKQAGINRISIGVQSLEDQTLHQIGRTHNAQKALNAVHTSHEVGITNISIDLMFELPKQTLKTFHNTLLQLENLPITHLSLYNLTIEPNTLFFKRTLDLPTPEENKQMLELATMHLEKIGLKRYEISAFAKPGYSSFHNIGYWTARPFLGFGPSAFSYFEKKRFRNIAHLSRYIKALQEDRSPVDFVEQLPYPQNVHELLAVQLRLLEGVDLKNFHLPKSTQVLLNQLVKEKFLECKGSHYKLSPKGLLFYDTVASAII